MLQDNNNIKKEIIRIFKEKMKVPHYRVLIFGSRASGQAEERSDIDIGVDSNTSIAYSTLSEIEEMLEKIPVLQKIDVVDFSEINERFRQVALRKIEVLYEQ